jgi:hypothetical protein
MGGQPLLRAIPMDDMNLAIPPKARSVDVNPNSPPIESSTAK